MHEVGQTPPIHVLSDTNRNPQTTHDHTTVHRQTIGSIVNDLRTPRHLIWVTDPQDISESELLASTATATARQVEPPMPCLKAQRRVGQPVATEADQNW